MGTTKGDITDDIQGSWGSIINYVWSTNLRDTNYRNIQYTQNDVLMSATGCHKMSSVDHLHAEAKMLKVREHSELLSAQYLARCLELGNVCHSITTRETPKRRMKETLFTRHRNTVEPMMLADNRKTLTQFTLTQSTRLVTLVKLFGQIAMTLSFLLRNFNFIYLLK